MQLVSDPAPIIILDLQQTSGKRAQDLFVLFPFGKIRNNDAKTINSVERQAIDSQGHRYPRTAG